MSEAISRLDIGCGCDKLPGSVGLDVNPRSDADVVHDLDKRPWPLAESSFDYVRANDVLEHVADFFGVMEEVFRVCRDGAQVDVRMPFFSSVRFATDPTHRRAGTSGTFDYFDPHNPFGRYRYSTARFQLVRFSYGRSYVPGWVGPIFRRIDWFLIPFLERNHVLYELYFAYIYPMHEISYTLRVLKPPQEAVDSK